MNRKLSIHPFQVISIAAIICLPIIFTSYFIYHGHNGTTNSITSILLLALSLLLTVPVVVAMSFRRSLTIENTYFQIEHSFYQLKIKLEDIQAIEIIQISKLSDIGISTKKNGIAAFGYYSGWFKNDRGQTIFCAISELPCFHFRFLLSEGEENLLLTCDVTLVEEIQAYFI